MNNRLFVSGDVSFNRGLFVLGDVSINNRLTVSGDTYIANRVFISGDISLNNRLFVSGDVSFNRGLFVLGDVSINNRLTVSGDTYIANRVFILRDASLNSRLFVAGDVSLNRGLFVLGDVSINSRLTVSGDTYISNRLFLKGDASLNGRLAVRQYASSVVGDISNALNSIFSVINYNTPATVGNNTAYFANVAANTNPLIILDVSGSSAAVNYIQFANNGGYTGKITSTTTTVSYGTTSDYRLKENIQEMTESNSIQTISQLRPITFNFKADPNTASDGFIAHELQSVLPQAVTGYKDEVDSNGNPVYQNVDSCFIIPYLTKSTQSLITKSVDASSNITLLQNQLYQMQPQNSNDFTITGDLRANSQSYIQGDLYANGNFILFKPITLNYNTNLINDAVGNQIGAQQQGQYIPFSKSTPVNATSVYSILLQPGMWLVEAAISYKSDSSMINTEYVSLSTELDSNDLMVLISTPIYSLYEITRCQRISNVFRLNTAQTIYASIQASDMNGSNTNITTLNNGCIKATRIA